MGADLGIVFTTEEGSQSGLISVKSKIQGNIPLTLSLSPSALCSLLWTDSRPLLLYSPIYEDLVVFSAVISNINILTSHSLNTGISFSTHRPPPVLEIDLRNSTSNEKFAPATNPN